MEKKELPDECKALMLVMSKVPHIQPTRNDNSDQWLRVLEYYELVEGTKDEQGNYIFAKLSEKGKVYMTLNPKLKDPSFWDDKHAIVDHVFNLIGAITPF